MEGASATIALLIAVVALGMAIAAFILQYRQGRHVVGAPTSGARTAELERRITQLGHRLEVVEGEVDTGSGSPATSGSGAAATLRTAGVALSHIGLVRFDAFEDTGGAQSFALALIDDDGDGIVLTSLHARQSTRLFVKGVRRGVSDLPLSSEEERAMRNAGIVPTV
jgi:hypothetical protein